MSKKRRAIDALKSEMIPTDHEAAVFNSNLCSCEGCVAMRDGLETFIVEAFAHGAAMPHIIGNFATTLGITIGQSAVAGKIEDIIDGLKPLLMASATFGYRVQRLGSARIAAEDAGGRSAPGSGSVQ